MGARRRIFIRLARGVEGFDDFFGDRVTIHIYCKSSGNSLNFVFRGINVYTYSGNFGTLGLLFLEGPLDDLGQTCSIVGRNL